MTSLHELMTYTKGLEYLISIWFVIGFVGLWQWVRGRGPGRIIKIAVLTYLVLGVGIQVVGCLGTAPR